MAETVPGGAYLASDGETYKDANGKPIKGDVVAEAQRIQQQQSQQKTQTLTPLPSQSNEALAAAVRSLLVPQAQPSQPAQQDQAPVVTDNTDVLVAETERRARAKG